MKPNLKLLIYLAAIVVGLVAFTVTLKATMRRFTYLHTYNAGFDALVSGDFAAARNQFDSCRAIYPLRSDVNSLLAAAYFYEDNLPKAREYFQTVHKPSAALGLALCQFREAQNQGQLTPAFIEGTARELRALGEKDPNVLAAALAVTVMGAVPDQEITPDISILTNYVIGKPEVQALPLAATYNSLGCLYMLNNAFAEAGIAFGHAARLALLPSDLANIRSNTTAASMCAVIKDVPVNDPDRIEQTFAGIANLTPANQRNAMVHSIRAFIKAGKAARAVEIIDSIKPETPAEATELNSLKMSALLAIAQQGKRGTTADALTKLAVFAESILDGLDPATAASSSSCDVKSLFNFMTNYYYAEKNNIKLAATTARALALFPDDPSYLRNMGVLKIRQGDFAGGMALLRDSLARDNGQNDLAAFLREVFAEIAVTDLRISTTPPFSVQQPMLKVLYKQGTVQLPPEVREMTMGGIPLRFLVQGGYILATPIQKLPDGFKDYAVRIVTANTATGQTASHTVTSAQDLLPPEVNVVFPPRKGEVKLTEIRIELEITDDRSEIDLGTLDIVISSGGTGQAYRFYAVKGGVYQSVKDQPRGKAVASGRIKFQPAIPVPGTYTMTVTVYDKAKNRQSLADWEFTLLP